MNKIPLYWSNIRLSLSKHNTWDIDYMVGSDILSHGQEYTRLYQPNIHIMWALPIIKEGNYAVKLYRPSYDYFTLYGSQINGWSDDDHSFAWLPKSKIDRHHNPNFCLDCGWFCLQQCKPFDKKARRVIL